ncbi:MAG: SAM-dependent methyltransferase [Bacteroidetes bacterium]|nr:SAM-dependent methyltransferase [Bacteroidota bacterium]
MQHQVQQFLEKISSSFSAQQFIKLTLGNKRNKQSDLKNVFVKPVIIKQAQQLSFTYRHLTQDMVKNYTVKDALILLEKMLQADFCNADLFTAANDYYLSIDKKEQAKLIIRPASLTIKEDAGQHDKVKNRIVNSTTAVYLKELGITTAEGIVKKDMQDKFKQINRYVEIIEGIIKEVDFGNELTVADMGSGKGYLTFALYDYLTNTLHKQAAVTGIEMRPGLVNKCNAIATAAQYDHLVFKEGTIADASIENIDMLIALHACDTATDDAIFKGITANAKVIVCAPCCHKQIRKQTAPANALKAITRHGILLERQAETLTDAIRALLLESQGYKTKVFEFISTEHTPKNVLIVGTKANKSDTAKKESLDAVKELKQLFGIQFHYLERLLQPH